MHMGMGEMLIVLVIAMLVFGPSKLPQLGDALGKGIRNFKQASREDDPEERRQIRAAAPVPAETTAARQERSPEA